MTIQDFDRLLQEQGSEIQQAYAMLKETEVRKAHAESAPDEGWNIWA
jgi:hypothetical protein